MSLTIRSIVLCMLIFGVAVVLAAEKDKIAELRRRAEQGDATVQIELGWAYENGNGVPKDYAVALIWYRRAAEQDDALGQMLLGNMYYNGNGVSRDYLESTEWFRRAAEQNLAIAQYSLGVMYLKGNGVHQNYIIAHFFFNLAGAKGLEMARKARDLLAEEMTVKQINEAQRRAREWNETFTSDNQ